MSVQHLFIGTYCSSYTFYKLILMIASNEALILGIVTYFAFASVKPKSLKYFQERIQN